MDETVTHAQRQGGRASPRPDDRLRLYNDVMNSKRPASSPGRDRVWGIGWDVPSLLAQR